MTPGPENTIFLTLAGSQAHGTAREGSDADVRGVCVAPLEVRLSLFASFEQFEGPLPIGIASAVEPQLRQHPTARAGMGVKTECVVFDVAKFVRLCIAANPNALEVLFADERDWLVTTPVWRSLYDERHRFLTRTVQQTFTGYAMAQLRKIRTHRSWLLNPPQRKPMREDFGLPNARGTLSKDDQNRLEQAIADKVRDYGVDTLEMSKPTRVALLERLRELSADVLRCDVDELDVRLRTVAISALQIPADVASALNTEKKYRAAMKQWEAYESWKANRNPTRAALEQQHGYDTKHGMHLIRLMRMGVEAMRDGNLSVRRPDADELNAIRDGKLTYEELLEEAEALQRQMGEVAAVTSLPAGIDEGFVDDMVRAVLQNQVNQA